jgi:mRNA interferase RelE/StbE
MIRAFYEEDFLKDLKKLKGTPYYKSIATLCFEQVPSLKSIADIPSLKKLKGYDNYYRIRKGDFRIGIKIEGANITFLRCLSRKDIYKYFPKKG